MGSAEDEAAQREILKAFAEHKRLLVWGPRVERLLPSLDHLFVLITDAAGRERLHQAASGSSRKWKESEVEWTQRHGKLEEMEAGYVKSGKFRKITRSRYVSECAEELSGYFLASSGD